MTAVRGSVRPSIKISSSFSVLWENLFVKSQDFSHLQRTCNIILAGWLVGWVFWGIKTL